jgi:hypothetical protein
MTSKEIENISEYFTMDSAEISAEKKWDNIFLSWISRIDQKKMMLNLFELKLCMESIEAFFSSSYLEHLVFKYTTSELRNYDFYFYTFNQVVVKVINLLKELDFKKDKYFLNFEEFIVDSILEGYGTRSFPYFKEIYAPESSWFSSLRIFLQNLKILTSELSKGDIISQRAYNSLKKIYHKELIGNPIILSLLKKNFIPRMDKIYQPDISEIIISITDKEVKKHVGIFFIFAFRVMKINNFIELHLNRSKNIHVAIPLVITLKDHLENIFSFYEKMLSKSLSDYFKDKKELKPISEVFEELKSEFNKIYDGEFPYYFDQGNEKINARKILKNIVIISDVAIKELIETLAKLFKPEISGSNIFENYISRKQQALVVKKKLTKLHTKINDYFTHKGNINPSDILFDINLFIETDLNYLLYKDWNEFLYYYNHLIKTNFSSEFDINLRAFHSFITKILKEMVNKS